MKWPFFKLLLASTSATVSSWKQDARSGARIKIITSRWFAKLHGHRIRPFDGRPFPKINIISPIVPFEALHVMPSLPNMYHFMEELDGWRLPTMFDAQSLMRIPINRTISRGIHMVPVNQIRDVHYINFGCLL